MKAVNRSRRPAYLFYCKDGISDFDIMIKHLTLDRYGSYINRDRSTINNCIRYDYDTDISLFTKQEGADSKLSFNQVLYFPVPGKIQSNYQKRAWPGWESFLSMADIDKHCPCLLCGIGIYLADIGSGYYS